MEVVYEDSDILVINKPPGLVIDREALEKPDRLVVHRLDKDTSGLLVFAKTPEALKNLQNQFRERKVKKRYWALAHGNVEPESGTINKPLGRAPKGVGKFVVVEGGRESTTNYKVKQHFVVAGLVPAKDGATTPLRHPTSLKLRGTSGFEGRARVATTLLDLEPLTGRTHQIRVHLKSIGHPIVGDKIYASRRQQRQDKKIIDRQFLHAYRLSFSHPRTEEWLRFEVDLPKDLREVLKILNSKS